MRRKNPTKFLAVLLSATMIAGSGTFALAAERSSDNVVVETQAANTASDGQTDDETQAQLTGTARIYSGEEQGTTRDITISGTNASVTFESSEASATEINYISLSLKPGDGETVQVGTYYNSSSKKMTGVQTPQSDGTYLINFAKGNGPAQKKSTYYVLVTSQDGATSTVYQLTILRKGYKALYCAGVGGSESNPSDGCWSAASLNEETGDLTMFCNLSYYPLMGGLSVSYTDADGKVDTNARMLAKAVVNPDYTGDTFYVETNEDGEEYVHAKRAGASSEFLQIEYEDEKIPVYLKALYTKAQGQTLLNAKKTDGVTTVDTTHFSDAEAFAAIFPASQKENAKTYYTLITELQAVIDANISMGKGSWDYEVAKSGEKKFWSDTCESAKLNQVMDLSKEIWENIYGLKDAKDAIVKYVDAENAPEDKKEEYQKLADEATAKLEADYKEGKLTSLEDVQTAVETAKTEIDQTIPTLEKCTVTLSQQEYTYDGTEKTPEVTVKNGEETVSPENYTVEYSDNTKAGTAKVTVTGKNGYRGSQTVEFTIKKAEEKQPEDGKQGTDTSKLLTVVKKSFVKTEGDKAFSLGIKKNKSASVSYQTSDKNVAVVNKSGKVTVKGPGRAVITVTAKAAGRKTETYKITVTVKPSSKLKTKAVARKGRKIQVNWKRNKKVSGYQIMVSSDKKFKKDVRKVTIRKNAVIKTQIRVKKAGRKYYVKVRSFKKYSKKTIFGNWVSAKAVKAVK